MTLTFDGTLVSATYVEATKTFTSSSITVPASGQYDVEVHSWNLVSDVTEYFNFTVETPILGATSTVEGGILTITVNESVDFSVMMTAGSSVQITWDYKDGTPLDTFSLGNLIAWAPAHKETRTHKFVSAGTFDVEITIFNSATSSSFTHTINVLSGVDGLALVTNSPVPYLNGQGTISFWFVSTSDVPTNASVYIDYGDGTTDGPLPFDIDDIHVHTYTTEGTYSVSANVSNALNNMVLARTVSTVEPVTNMELYVSPEHAAVGSAVTVGVTMEKGSDVVISWNFGDAPGNDVVQNRTGILLDLELVLVYYSTVVNLFFVLFFFFLQKKC